MSGWRSGGRGGVADLFGVSTEGPVWLRGGGRVQAWAGGPIAAVNSFGRLDIVVNNAGVTRDRMIASTTEDDFDVTIAVHLKATFALCHHAASHWRTQSKNGEPVSGRIINTTSGTGLFGNPGQSSYGAAKAGIIGVTLTLARELRRYGVTVNAISPLARTRMTEGVFAEAADDAFDRLDPAKASGVVAYLASEHAGWLTGQVLRVDGDRLVRMQGWTAADEYVSIDGGALTPDELVDGVPVLYGALNAGVTSTKRR